MANDDKSGIENLIISMSGATAVDVDFAPGGADPVQIEVNGTGVLGTTHRSGVTVVAPSAFGFIDTPTINTTGVTGVDMQGPNTPDPETIKAAGNGVLGTTHRSGVTVNEGLAGRIHKLRGTVPPAAETQDASDKNQGPKM